jgi:hypothetical protein
MAMTKYFLSFCFIFLMASEAAIAGNHEKDTTGKTFRVGVFAPVYLDSAFNGSTYKYGKNFPRFTFAGLEFMQGAQIALDSLSFNGATIEATFFDTQSNDFSNQFNSETFGPFDLLIGSVREMDYNLLAALARKNNIPFVSVTYPNDGGVTSNPFLMILNATLKSHCESIYSYVLQQYSSHKIIFCTKSGAQEERVMEYFQSFNSPDGSPLMEMNVVQIDQGTDKLLSVLDSNRNNIIVGASLDESFAKQLGRQSMLWNKKYNIKLIGMPNWDGIFNLRNAKNNPDYPVYFTSAFYNAKDDEYSALLENTYHQKFKVSPSDYAQKGFESIAVFVKMLTEHPNDFMSHINHAGYRVFTNFNFKPVKVTAQAKIPDYFENKHLYFMKSENGKISKAW